MSDDDLRDLKMVAVVIGLIAVIGFFGPPLAMILSR